MADWQDRLAEAMQARGLSGGELARKTGFTAQYINSLRNKARGGRLPLATVRRLSHALAVSVEWLGTGNGPRERPGDVHPALALVGGPSERYPGRAEAIALLETTVESEVIAALRASLPDDPAVDPGRDFWIQRARELVRDLRRIQADPELTPNAGPREPLEARRRAP
ncbi:MAG TPA: helix-turn-helix transcriptional regulator [Polyangiaceae bacterium]